MNMIGASYGTYICFCEPCPGLFGGPDRSYADPGREQCRPRRARSSVRQPVRPAKRPGGWKGIGKRTPGGHREEWHRNHGRPGGGMQKPGSGPMSPMSPMSPLAKASSHPPTVTSRRPRAWIRGSPGSRAGSTCPRWPPRCSPRTCGRARGRIPGVPPRGCPCW